MTKRNVGGVLLALAVSITAAIASCSFPTYEINVTGTVGSTGGASATASSSSSGSGAGGAPSTSASTTSSTSGSGGSSVSTSTSTASSSSSTGGFDAGACPVDEDKDGVTSWQCPGGTDCADQDDRAHPGADYTVGDPINGLKRPGTLPYDFNCMKGEEKQTLTLNCAGGLCGDTVTEGFQSDVDCGVAGALGHCGGALPCAWISLSKNVVQLCK